MTTTSTRSIPLPALLIPLAIAAAWGVPRLVVAVLGDGSPWTAFFYQYLMGGMVFAIGLLIIRRSGACDFDRPGDRFWYRVLIFGYLWYAGMHALIIFLAISVPQRT
jgi:hypothetical protein